MSTGWEGTLTVNLIRGGKMADEPFSVTRLAAFRRCPKRFWYRYVKGQKGGFKTVEAFLGDIIHKSLAWLYRAPSQPRVEKRGLYDYFLATWEPQVSAGVRVVRSGDSLEHQRARGIHMVDQYFDRIYLKDRKKTLEIEYKFQLDLKGKYRLVGVIDRLAVDGEGDIFVIDYKTTKRGARGPDEDTDLQLDAYGLWALLKLGVGCVYQRVELLQNATKYVIRLKRAAGNTVVNELAARIEEVREKKRRLPRDPRRFATGVSTMRFAPTAGQDPGEARRSRCRFSA
jgi:RecB family exonuclease